LSETLSTVVAPSGRRRGVPALFVGLAGDAPLTPPARLALAGIDRVVVGRADARRFTRSRVDGADQLDVALADARLSTRHLRLSRLGTSWVVEDLESKNGTWIAGARVTRHALADGDVLIAGHSALLFRAAAGDAGDLDGWPPSVAPGLGTLVPSLAAELALLERATRSTVPIEITGASGTGKELVARAVHQLSGRRGNFVSVNCGALTPSLLEGELFGHRRGAFTGAADDRLGLVRSADRGTLFLDEVAELPLTSQAALLRVLQEGEVVPLGADRPVPVDLRLVSATHRDLAAEVDAGRFRGDLRARLLGVSISLPALRDRREDLAAIITAILERVAPDRALTFSADAVGALYSYDWPFNVRELERALSAAVAVADDRIDLQHLPAPLRIAPRAASAPSSTGAQADAELSPDDLELRDTIAASVARHRGNLTAVARELGKDRTQIRRWMKRFGLSRDVDEDKPA
jgi:transcriptional regulator of acetoin/glycerol metabolism